MTDYVPAEARGELPEAVFALLDWGKFNRLLQDAVLAQDHDTRKIIIEDSGEAGDHGPIVNMKLRPFDADGYLVAAFAGNPLLRVHYTRLLPGVPPAVLDV